MRQRRQSGSAGRRGSLAARAVAAGLVAALALSACGLGDKQAQAAVIIASVDRVFAAGTAVGTLEVAMRVVELPAGAPIGGVELGEGTPGLAGQSMVGSAVPVFDTGVSIDFGGDRAELRRSFDDTAFARYEGLVLAGLRPTASERDARPWVRLDLEALDDGSGRLNLQEDLPAIAAFGINPVLLVDLAAGPLAGSVEPQGSDVVNGVATTRYEANFDLEKVLRNTRRDRYPEERREAVEDLFERVGVTGITHPGEVWIDDAGALRRFVLRLRQEPRRDLTIELVLDLELHELGNAVDVAMPGVDERLEVGSIVQFLRAVVPPPDMAMAAEGVVQP